MLVDRYPREDVFARVPELVGQTDPVLRQLDRLLDDDALSARVRADLGQRYPKTLCRGRHATPVAALLRLLVVKHLYARSYREPERRVADSLVLRWFCRLYFRRVPDATTLLRWARTIRPATLHALNDRVVELARRARVTAGRGGPPGGSWASTGRSWRRRSTTRPTAAGSPTGCAPSAA